MDVRARGAALADGCHIVVGTPGRTRDHLERGRLDTSAPARGRSRRGGRDARPRLSRGSRIHPRFDPGRAPHAALLGDHPPRDRDSRQALPARRVPDRHRRPEPAARGYRVPRHPHRAATRSSTASSTCCATSRRAGAMVFCKTREAVQAPACEPARARLLLRCSVGRADPERAHQRASGAARRARPGLRRDRRRGARHRSSRSRARDPRRSPRTIPIRCCIAPAARAAPGARASACCSCPTRAVAGPRAC